MALPTQERRSELLRNLDQLLALTESTTSLAARTGVCDETIRRRIRIGQLEGISIGRDIRVWRDV